MSPRRLRVASAVAVLGASNGRLPAGVATGCQPEQSDPRATQARGVPIPIGGATTLAAFGVIDGWPLDG